MAAKLISLRVVLATAYIAVSAASLVGSVRVTNTGSHTAYIVGSGSYADVELSAGTSIELHGVDLSTVYVKGTANDIVTVIGQAGAWGL